MKLPSAMVLINAIQPVWRDLTATAASIPATRAAIDAAVEKATPALMKAIRETLYAANGIK